MNLHVPDVHGYNIQFFILKQRSFPIKASPTKEDLDHYLLIKYTFSLIPISMENFSISNLSAMLSYFAFICFCTN